MKWIRNYSGMIALVVALGGTYASYAVTNDRTDRNTKDIALLQSNVATKEDVKRVEALVDYLVKREMDRAQKGR